MRVRRPILLGGLLLGATCAGSPDVSKTDDDASSRVTALVDRYVKEYFDAFPYQAVFGAPDAHPDRLGDHSLAALARWDAQEDAMLADLRGIDPAPLAGRPQEITYRFLENLLASARDYRVCRMEVWNVSPTWTGWQATMAMVAGRVATGTDGERNAAYARFAQLPKYLDDEIDNLKEGLRLGYTAEAQRAGGHRAGGRHAVGAGLRVAIRADRR